MRLRSFAPLLALCVLAAALPSPAVGTGEITIAVFGDTGVNSVAKANVARAVEAGAAGYLGLGDYQYDATISAWRSQMLPLTSKGAWLALGNHDIFDNYKGMMPGGSASWSIAMGGARVIAINTERSMAVGSSQYNWFVNELKKPEAFKAVVMHKGWWLGSAATHDATEFPGSKTAMDGLVHTYGVDLVIAGHEHNYQRAVRNGNVTYLVVGTGGRSLYDVAGSPSGTVATCKCYGGLLLTLSATGLSGRFIDTTGKQRDSFQVVAAAAEPTPTPAPTPTPSPSPGNFSATFTPKAVGNDWWIEVGVASGQAVARVDASRNGGTWAALSATSWGTWAKSLAAPNGTVVQFRATNATGAQALSQLVTWT